ncbi:MAG: hypothetical protein DWQ01_01510 [Planctomycetota bacterium]|nr:MAG: hypothetical protein DWQ01_01510 [Planctomycetota bacterium]
MKKEREKEFGKRKSESRKVVNEVLSTLKSLIPIENRIYIQSDRKKLYPSVIKQVFGKNGFVHLQECSKRKRDKGNPLFPINHTLAQMRDNISRLVRRNWGVSKKRNWLVPHLWLWLVWRNYVRPITADGNPPTPGELVGASSHRYCPKEIFQWRIFQF